MDKSYYECIDIESEIELEFPGAIKEAYHIHEQTIYVYGRDKFSAIENTRLVHQTFHFQNEYSYNTKTYRLKIESLHNDYVWDGTNWVG